MEGRQVEVKADLPVGESRLLMGLPCPAIWGELIAPQDRCIYSVRANDAFFEMIGLSRADFYQCYKGAEEDILSKGDWSRVEEAIETLRLTGKPSTLIHEFNVKNREKITVSVNIGRVEITGAKDYFVAVYSDYTRINEKERELEHRIQMDQMTGLYNKTSTETVMKQIIQKKTEGTLSMIMVDVDNFKMVNDSFGHLFGDVVIRDIAGDIKECFGSDAIVGRIGGDEFLVLVQDQTKESLEQFLYSLHKAISYQYLADDGVVNISGSVGYTIVNAGEAEYDELFRQADTAMYYSKENGKKRFACYHSQMPAIGLRQRALRRKREEINQDRSCDMEFVADAYHLLSDSRFVESSLQMLLRKIVERFNLQSAQVFEFDQVTGKYHQVNGWTEDDQKEQLPGIETSWISEHFRKKDQFQIADATIYEGMSSAIACCKLPQKRNVDGFLCFSAKELIRNWTEYEMNTQEEMGKAIAIFLSLEKERVHEKERMEEISSKDQITGIMNMKSFEQHLSKVLLSDDDKKNDNITAVMVMDIENFSLINEKFGYEAGNDILRTMAKTIGGNQHICSAARAYCDCFQILAESISREALQIETEYYIQTLRRILRQKYPALDLQVKIGIYCIEEEDVHAYLVLENANLARKEGKRESGTQIVFYRPEFRRNLEYAGKITAEMQMAISQDELLLYFQPKFSLSQKEVIGLEAFGRWFTKQGTLRTSNEYLPALKKSGRQGELDLAILRLVLQTLRRWHKEGRTLYPISINMDGRLCCRPGFVKKIVNMTRQYDVASSWIELEVSSNDVSIYQDKLANVLDELHKYGFRIAVDNFGTGYEAVKLIMDRKFDVIKVDRDFLCRTTNQEERVGYMKYLNHLAEAQKQQVVFIGAETKEQAEELQRCGYKSVQGYYFEKVISVDQFECMY